MGFMQLAFMKQVGTTDGMFTVRQIMDGKVQGKTANATHVLYRFGESI